MIVELVIAALVGFHDPQGQILPECFPAGVPSLDLVVLVEVSVELLVHVHDVLLGLGQPRLYDLLGILVEFLDVFLFN